MALSAAGPIYRGYLTDIDTRWYVIAASVDDRTREERGLEVRNHGNLPKVYVNYPAQRSLEVGYYLVKP